MAAIKILVPILVLVIIIGVLSVYFLSSAPASETKKLYASTKKQFSTINRTTCEIKFKGKSVEIADERAGYLTKTQVCMPFDEELVKCSADHLEGCWTKESCKNSGGLFCTQGLTDTVSNDASVTACFHQDIAPCLVKAVKESCSFSNLKACNAKEECEIAGGVWRGDGCEYQEEPPTPQQGSNIVLEDAYFASQDGAKLFSAYTGQQFQIKIFVKNSGNPFSGQIANNLVIKKDGIQVTEKQFYLNPSNLKPGEVIAEKISGEGLFFSSSGEYCIDIELDIENVLKEPQEENKKIYEKVGCISVGPRTVLEWRFDSLQDSAIKDSSADIEKNEGTLKGINSSQVFKVAGRDGRGGLAFDGIDDLIVLDKPLDVAGDDISLAFWIRIPKDLPSATQEIMSLRSADDLRMIIDRSGIGFVYKNKPFYVNPNKGWAHIVFVSKRTDEESLSSLYLNGEAKISEEQPIFLSEKLDIVVGGGSYGFFNGLIDDIQIYNTALAEAEIKSLYSSAKNPAEVVLDWRMDEGRGDVISDLSDFGNSGQMNQAKWAAGVSKHAILLDSTGSYVRGKELDITGPEFAATFSLKISENPKFEKGENYIFNMSDSPDNGNQFIALILGKKGIGIVVKGRDRDHEIYSSNMPVDEWMQIQIILAKTAGEELEASFFINGELKGKETAIPPTALYPVLQGFDGGKIFFDELKIYSGSNIAARRCRADNDCQQGEKCKPDAALCIKIPSCKKIIDSGSLGSKLDIAFLYDGNIDGAGFKEKIMGWASYDDTEKQGIFGVEPFKSNKEKFNLWIVPSQGNMLVNPADIGNIVNNIQSANKAISQQCPNADYAIVVSQIPFRSFSVGNLVFISETYSKDRIVSRLLHELGHVIFRLADEYTEQGGGKKPARPNCAKNAEEAVALWGSENYIESSLISKDPSGNIKVQFDKGVVGFYRGCSFTDDNIRPTEISVMRSVEAEPITFGPVSMKYMLSLLSRYK